MVLKVLEPISEELQTQYVVLQGSCLAGLRLLDRATGECQFRCLQDSSPTSLAANRFKFKVRATTTDQAAANHSAETAFMQGRSEQNWAHLHLPCNMHIIAKAHSRSFDIVQNQISGMLNFALSLSLGGNMLKFRVSLIAVVRQRLQIIVGHPPADAQAYRQFILSHFCSSGRNLAVKRFLLEHFANGDWRCKDAVQLYVEPGLEVNAAGMVDQVCSALALALTGSLFKLYPRHRWVGADGTVAQIGLCEAVHGLASATFKHMTSGGADVVDRAGVQEGEESDPWQGGSAPPERGSSSRDRHMPEEEPGMAVEAAGEDEVMPPASTAGPTGAESSPDWTDLSQLNARQSLRAQQWLLNQPMPHLIGMKLCLEPISRLLHKHLARCSEAWETQQRAKVAAAGLDEDTRRPMALLEYVQLTAEKHFFEDLQKCLDPGVWKHVEESYWTLQFQTIYFRLTSRMGALVHELLVLPTHRYPLQVFSLILNHSLLLSGFSLPSR